MSKHRRPRPAPPAMWACTALPLWARVGLYAQQVHGNYLPPGELATVLFTTPGALSNAIAKAKHEGVLTHDSTARRLHSTVKP